MPDYEDARFGPCDGDIEAVRVVCEACVACCIGSDEADDHDVRFLSLGCVDGADSHLVAVSPVKLPRQQVVLRSVWSEDQDVGRACPAVLVQNGLHDVANSVSLRLVDEATTVGLCALLSLAVNVEHAVMRLVLGAELACVLSSFVFGLVGLWPWDS